MMILILIGLSSFAFGSSYEQSPTYDAARAVVSVKVQREIKCGKNACFYEAKILDIVKDSALQHLLVGTTIQIATAIETKVPPAEARVIFLAGSPDHWRLVQDSERSWDDPGPRCVAAGGEMKPGGLGGNVMCIKPYPDAGKPCTRESECLGGCFYEGPRVSSGTKVTGSCKRNNYPFGCKTPVYDGVVKGTLCAD